jgi:hypothetical protein
MILPEEDFDLRVARAGLMSALLAHVGYAFWQLSECEDAVAHLLVLRLKAERGMGEEQGMRLLAEAQRRTFGSLLHELKKASVLEATIEERLFALLTERNWLVHHAKRESRGILFRDDDFDRLVARVDAIAEEATELEKAVAASLEAFVVSTGVDRATIDREATRLARSWGYPVAET